MTGRPSSSQRFNSFGASFGEVRFAGSIPGTPNEMISFLILTSIRVNGCSSLMLYLGVSRSNPSIAQLAEQKLDVLIASGNEKINSFGAKQNRSALPRFALCKQVFTQRLQIRKSGELIGGDIGKLSH